jgi:lipopolysaccharide transport system permease protein
MTSSYLRNLWHYRHYIGSTVWLEVRLRFARSRVGGFWLVAQPLIQVAVYAVILSSVLQAKLPNTEGKYAYTLYLLAGMIAWSLFAEIFNRSLTVFIDHAGTLKKVVFPRICLPVIVVAGAGFNYLLLLGATLVAVPLLGGTLSWHALSLIPLTVLVMTFAAGLGLLFGTLNVFMRDIGQALGVLLQLWFWFTPVVYPLSIVPEQVAALMALNPMLPVVHAYQDLLVRNLVPDWYSLWPVVLVAATSLVLALITFRRAAPDMVDVL